MAKHVITVQTGKRFVVSTTSQGCIEVQELRTKTTLTRSQADILEHIAQRAAGGFFCGDSPDMQVLVKLNLMYSAGRKVGVPDEYFQLSPKGLSFVKAL